jgi:hypothetical protein
MLNKSRILYVFTVLDKKGVETNQIISGISIREIKKVFSISASNIGIRELVEQQKGCVL